MNDENEQRDQEEGLARFKADLLGIKQKPLPTRSKPRPARKSTGIPTSRKIRAGPSKRPQGKYEPGTVGFFEFFDINAPKKRREFGATNVYAIQRAAHFAISQGVDRRDLLLAKHFMGTWSDKTARPDANKRVERLESILAVQKIEVNLGRLEKPVKEIPESSEPESKPEHVYKYSPNQVGFYLDIINSEQRWEMGSHYMKRLKLAAHYAMFSGADLKDELSVEHFAATYKSTTIKTINNTSSAIAEKLSKVFGHEVDFGELEEPTLEDLVEESEYEPGEIGYFIEVKTTNQPLRPIQLRRMRRAAYYALAKGARETDQLIAEHVAGVYDLSIDKINGILEGIEDKFIKQSININLGRLKKPKEVEELDIEEELKYEPGTLGYYLELKGTKQVVADLGINNLIRLQRASYHARFNGAKLDDILNSKDFAATYGRKNVDDETIEDRLLNIESRLLKLTGKEVHIERLFSEEEPETQEEVEKLRYEPGTVGYFLETTHIPSNFTPYRWDTFVRAAHLAKSQKARLKDRLTVEHLSGIIDLSGNRLNRVIEGYETAFNKAGIEISFVRIEKPEEPVPEGIIRGEGVETSKYELGTVGYFLETQHSQLPMLNDYQLILLKKAAHFALSQGAKQKDNLTIEHIGGANHTEAWRLNLTAGRYESRFKEAGISVDFGRVEPRDEQPEEMSKESKYVPGTIGHVLELKGTKQVIAKVGNGNLIRLQRAAHYARFSGAKLTDSITAEHIDATYTGGRRTFEIVTKGVHNLEERLTNLTGVDINFRELALEKTPVEEIPEEQPKYIPGQVGYFLETPTSQFPKRFDNKQIKILKRASYFALSQGSNLEDDLTANEINGVIPSMVSLVNRTIRLYESKFESEGIEVSFGMVDEIVTQKETKQRRVKEPKEIPAPVRTPDMFSNDIEFYQPTSLSNEDFERALTDGTLVDNFGPRGKGMLHRAYKHMIDDGASMSEIAKYLAGEYAGTQRDVIEKANEKIETLDTVIAS